MTVRPVCPSSVVVLREKVEEARQLLLSEFNVERSHHQKMVKDFTRLQQRFENLKGDMQVLASPPGGAPVYKRQGSGSAEATGSDEAPEGREKVMSVTHGFYFLRVFLLHICFIMIITVIVITTNSMFKILSSPRDLEINIDVSSRSAWSGRFVGGRNGALKCHQIKSTICR